jgi:hypothetical protein
MTAATPTLPQECLLGTPQPFFKLLELHSGQVEEYSTAIQQLRDGELTGIIVRDVYSSDFMTTVTERLEAHDPPFLKTLFPEKFKSWFYGRNLNLMGTDPTTYFQQAAEFHQQMQELLPGELGIPQRVMTALSQLDAGRPYRAAPGPEPGQDYMLTTFRGHAEGGYISAHCDNEQSVRDSYEHLGTLVGNHMYSMVLMIGASDDGGALEVFDYRVEPGEAGGRTGATAGHVDQSALSSVQIKLQPGDLVVVDSGRYLHQVTPVIGQKNRWVACSFMAKSLERNAVYCWG